MNKEKSSILNANEKRLNQTDSNNKTEDHKKQKRNEKEEEFDIYDSDSISPEETTNLQDPFTIYTSSIVPKETKITENPKTEKIEKIEKIETPTISNTKSLEKDTRIDSYEQEIKSIKEENEQLKKFVKKK